MDACKQRDLCCRDIVQKVFVCAYYDAKYNVKHVKSMQNKMQVGAASACYASKQSLYHGNEKRVT